jgi:hypothetical protein
MPRVHVRVNRHLNAGRAFEKVSRKLIDWITESEHASRHAAPLYIKRLYDRPHNVPQRVSGSQTIRNRKSVQYAGISGVKFGGTFVKVSSGATIRNGNDPESLSRGNSGVIRMQAQRARCRKAVKSYERECALMDFSIRAAELPGHESHVRMEIVAGTLA